MKITAIRSDRIYRDMMTALPTEKENIYRNRLMKPFEFKWACVGIPLTAAQEGGYDVVSAAAMSGFYAPAQITEARRTEIEKISGDSFWESCEASIRDTLIGFEQHGIQLPKQEYVFTVVLSDPQSPMTVMAGDYLDLATGLRRGELLGLKWSDIDLNRGVLKIQRAISRQNGKVVEAPLKTKNAYRTLPLSADAIDVLMQQRRKSGNSEWVFPSPSGGPMSPDSVLHMLQRVLKRAGLPRIRFHDLRHTFATMALQNGVDVKTVSSMLGHYSAGFTLDTYAHVTTDAQLKAAQTMGNILSRAVLVLSATRSRWGQRLGQKKATSENSNL